MTDKEKLEIALRVLEYVGDVDSRLEDYYGGVHISWHDCLMDCVYKARKALKQLQEVGATGSTAVSKTADLGSSPRPSANE